MLGEEPQTVLQSSERDRSINASIFKGEAIELLNTPHKEKEKVVQSAEDKSRPPASIFRDEGAELLIMTQKDPHVTKNREDNTSPSSTSEQEIFK